VHSDGLRIQIGFWVLSVSHSLVIIFSFFFSLGFSSASSIFSSSSFFSSFSTCFSSSTSFSSSLVT